jgi:hypothetical protein
MNGFKFLLCYRHRHVTERWNGGCLHNHAVAYNICYRSLSNNVRLSILPMWYSMQALRSGYPSRIHPWQTSPLFCRLNGVTLLVTRRFEKFLGCAFFITLDRIF